MGTLAGVAEFPGRFDECMTITGRTRALLSGRLWHSRRQWRGRRQRGIPRSHGGRRCCGFECQVVNVRRSENWSRVVDCSSLRSLSMCGFPNTAEGDGHNGLYTSLISFPRTTNVFGNLVNLPAPRL